MLLTGGIVVATASAGLVAGVAGPASADPVTTYVAVGSDTTQDVMNGLAQGLGGGFVGSWDAINPNTGAAHDLITAKPGCQFARPNGSGEGVDALRTALGGGPGTAPTPRPGTGCVDIARSSSGPATNASGQLVYIPFALDAVAMATGPASAVTGSDPSVATSITNADQFSLGTLAVGANPSTGLIRLYHDCLPTVVGGVTYTPDVNIHLYIPQSGSGTRKFWAQKLGNFDPTSPPSCVHDHIFDPVAGTFTGAQVQEHDGTVFTNDALAVAPFSIAQWISQSRTTQTHAIDRRHNATLHSMSAVDGGTAVPPTIAGGNLNSAFPITREVFNVVKYDLVVAVQGDPVQPDPNLQAIFVGTGSALCSLGSVIRRFGFATLDGTSSPHTCGATSNDLRAFPTL
jgi:ABC-type phosphate transport system substrate-binding protein